MIFCTLFNWAYLPQGIALYRSLENTCKGEFALHVLCIDDFTAAVLVELELPNIRIIHLREVEDDQLKAVRATRTIGEFCWTCTTPLLLHLQNEYEPGSIITYVDADLFFYSDPSVVLKELGSGSILVHEHDYSPEYEHLDQSAGRFNVGLISVRNNEQGRTCLRRWREQVLQECVYDPAAGKCGDQNYLDEWPQLYSELVISTNPGIGLAPWNISKYRLGLNARGVTVDDQPAIFYHFHSLRLLRPRLGIRPLLTATGAYVVGDDVVASFYRPYARSLWHAVRCINSTKSKTGLKHDFAKEFPTLPREYPKCRNEQFCFSFYDIAIPVRYNAQLMSWLYGIDADRSHL
jgi:hypothetical protein